MLRRRKTLVAPPPPGCALTECMRMIAGTWTPNVLWYLRGEPRRFSELKADLKGVSSKVLTARLRRLERDGIVSRREVASTPPSVEYSLTELGREVVPALTALVEVGHRLKAGPERDLGV